MNSVNANIVFFQWWCFDLSPLHAQKSSGSRLICRQTQLDDIAHEQTIIYRQLVAGHAVGSRPMKRKKNLHYDVRPLLFYLAACSLNK